jgi:hypothetical protein
MAEHSDDNLGVGIPLTTAGLPCMACVFDAIGTLLTDEQLASIPRHDDGLSADEQQRCRLIGATVAYVSDELVSFAVKQVGPGADEIIGACVTRMFNTMRTHEAAENFINRLKAKE